jgi:hypothetical protein
MSPHPKIAPHRGIAAILAEWGRGTIYRSAYIALSNGRGTPISHANAESLIAGAWYPKMAITLGLTSTELANPSDVVGLHVLMDPDARRVGTGRAVEVWMPG